MGLFDSETKHYVSTSVQRAVEDKMLPDSVRTGVINGIFTTDDIPMSMVEELITSIGSKAERMYAYAKRDYIYGLPSGTVYSNTQGSAEVQAVLDTLEGVPVLLDYSRYGPFNYIHYGWTELLAQHGYDPVTNKLGVLTGLKGRDVYLEDMVVVLPPGIYATLEASSLEEWGLTPNSGYSPQRMAQDGAVAPSVTHFPYIEDATATAIHLRVTAAWEERTTLSGKLFPEANGRYQSETFVISLPVRDSEADYFHAKYTVNGLVKYWRYEVGSGTYPTLDAVFDDPPDTAGEYFPFIYYRFKKKSMAKSEGTPDYASSQKMVKYLGMDYDAMIAAIHENPGITDIEQAMTIFAANPNSTNEYELRYLFDYFKEQYAFQNPEKETEFGRGIIENFTHTVQRNTTTIRDARFKLTLSNSGIYKKLIPGSIGPKGTYAGGLRTDNVPYAYTSYDTEGVATPVSGTAQVKVHYFQHQVDDSLYEMVEVRRLILRYHIYGKYSTIGANANPILLVPLDHSITRNYPLPVREQLYARCMHYVFNSHVEVEVQWYQQDWFQVVMIVAAVVITFFYPPGGTAFWSGVAAGTVTMMQVITTFAIIALTALVIRAGLKLLVKAIGGEAAMILAIVATVAAAYGYFNSTGVEGAPWAEDLLQLANGLTNAVSEDLGEAFTALQEDQSEFALFVEKQTETLEKAQSLLETHSYLSPFVIFGEKPEDFYNRTVHSGNIGIVGISAIGSFVDAALTLPTLNETLGDSFNGWTN